MKYAALLRGINVGGKNIVRMEDLRSVFKTAGFTHIDTYIQSGNVTFETKETNHVKITRHIESALIKKFTFPIRVMIRTHQQLKTVLAQVPDSWHTEADIRRYIAFLSPSIKPAEAVTQIEFKEGIDEFIAGETVIYLSTQLDGLTKSKLNKLVGKKIYKEMTMRNYVTSKKLLELLDGEFSITRSDKQLE